MNFSKAALAVLVLFLFPALVSAKLIDPGGLLMKIIESNSKIMQFSLDLQVTVYDPEALLPLEEEPLEPIMPYEVADNNFAQNMIFVRDEILAIETLDLDKNLLHVYLKEHGRTRSTNLTDEGRFLIEDILYHYSIFFTKHEAFLKESLDALGILSRSVSMQRLENSYVYQLGDDSGNILVDPTDYRVLEINRQIQYEGRYFSLSIRFVEWHKTNERIPGRIQYFVNSRLFKEVEVVGIRYRGLSRRISRWIRANRGQLETKSPFDVRIDFAR